MKIRMLQTVEDTHKWLEGEPNREKTLYDTSVFREGEEYDGTNVKGDWSRRSAGLVALGYAEKL